MGNADNICGLFIIISMSFVQFCQNQIARIYQTSCIHELAYFWIINWKLPCPNAQAYTKNAIKIMQEHSRPTAFELFQGYQHQATHTKHMSKEIKQHCWVIVVSCLDWVTTHMTQAWPRLGRRTICGSPAFEFRGTSGEPNDHSPQISGPELNLGEPNIISDISIRLGLIK